MPGFAGGNVGKMQTAVKQIGESEEQVVGVAVRPMLPAQKAISESAFYLGALLIFLQAADGVLTSVGISRFGLAAEGNPILRHLMAQFGHIPTLMILKLFAVAIIVGLVRTARRLPWISGAIGAVSCVYIFAAIVPWTYILFIR
jgi:hypothetical protein